jgi:hypothetical protein
MFWPPAPDARRKSSCTSDSSNEIDCVIGISIASARKGFSTNCQWVSVAFFHKTCPRSARPARTRE